MTRALTRPSRRLPVVQPLLAPKSPPFYMRGDNGEILVTLLAAGAIVTAAAGAGALVAAVAVAAIRWAIPV